MERNKSVMLYDGDCHFCKRWVRRARKLTKGGIIYVPYQGSLDAFPQVTEKQCESAVQLIDADGAVYSGSEAVFKSIEDVRGFGWLYALYKKSSLFRRFSEMLYRFVARNRATLSRIGL